MPQITHSIQEFLAQGEFCHQNGTIPVSISGRFSKEGSDPVQCSAVPKGEDIPITFNPLEENNPAHLKGKAEDGDAIWINKLSEGSAMHSDSQISWKGIADFFLKGDLDEFDATGGEIICVFNIPRTPLGISDVEYTRSFNGTVTFSKNDERKGIRWRTEVGEAELIDNYQYREDWLGLDKAIIRIQRCQISVKVQGEGIVALGEVIKGLKDELDETLWLMSLLSRSRLAWYGGEAIFMPKDGTHKRFMRAIVRRQQWLGFERNPQKSPSWLDLPITPNELRGALFQRLLSRFVSSPHKHVLRRTIPYVIMSSEKGYFEAQVGNAYLALESLVDGLSSLIEVESDFVLPHNDFGQLAGKLKQVINEEVSSKSSSRDLIRSLEKINRAKHPSSFVDRLLSLISKLGVPAERLWPINADLSTEIREMRQRRDAYIHMGRLENINEYHLDLIRVRFLAELCILSLLGCPGSALNPYAFRRFSEMG